MAIGAEPDAGARAANARAEDVLASAELTVVGAMADASNATLYTRLHRGEQPLGSAIYKPASGERPLWDFAQHTLHKREVATYELARFAGLDVVPPTVLRDGPFGPGSVQLWVGPTPEQVDAEQVPPPAHGAGVIDLCRPDQVPPGWKRVLRAHDGQDVVVLCHADDSRLAAMALLDVLANNADRKGGHVIDVGDGRLAGVDHGLTFHTEPKLRTVLWGWTGQPLPDALREAAVAVRDGIDGPLGRTLAPLLDDDEIEALADRAHDLVRAGVFPGPHGHGPAIPWPAF